VELVIAPTGYTLAGGTTMRFSLPDVIRLRSRSAGRQAGIWNRRTQTPEVKGEKQPQGWTGPTTAAAGGAPASSPQSQTPPGMQAAPEGSSKTTVAPNNDK